MKIRKAQEKDLEECEKLLDIKELRSAGGWHPSEEVLRNHLGNYFLVAEEAGKIFACNVAEPIISGVICWWFAVRKEARGRGIGTSMMKTIENQAKKDKKYFFVVYSKNKSKAIKFYKKLGYKQGQDFTELTKGL